ncbi:MAG: hypothetical protein Q9179_003860, partial [Wetmoreana sp. 5 TL-2023]
SSSIVDENSHQPLLSILTLIVETAVKLHEDGHRVIIVSSGAIAKLKRIQYQNAQNTFAELLNMGVIPIVNENDTLAVSEIRFGDNDTLSAITAAMVQADYLFLMTDVDCLYDKNPRTNLDATPIEVVEDVASLEADVSSAGSSLGTGGMATKLIAARLATSAGVTTVITRSSNPGNVANVVNYCQSLKSIQQEDLSSSQPLTPATVDEDPLSNSMPSLQLEASTKPPLHTRFLPDPEPIRDRSFWLLYGLTAHGTIFIDEGAHRALISKAGLLPVGIIGVQGNFAQQEAVRLVVVSTGCPNPSGLPDGLSTATSAAPAVDIKPPLEIGRALVNYSAAEIARIKGLQSTRIEGILGYAHSEYVALRENVSLVRIGREKGNRTAETVDAVGARSSTGQTS